MRRLKSERLKRGWRQEDLGYHTRMSGADISRIENGRMVPYPTQVERLCRVLELQPDELLEEVEASGVRVGV
jgi:transcriptional regulator with XRE-family HTH domain